MKIFVKYILVLVFLPICALAQIGKDSIYVNPYPKRIYTQNFLQHNLSSPANFGEMSLGYTNRKGNGKLAQHAHDSQNIDFYALGANQLGDFRISGDFLFNKIFEDSLSFGQRNNIDTWSPFNYFASKAGTYERQNYKSNITISYNWKQKIQPFFNVNYLSHWTTGSVDPRFESKKFEMKYNPGVIFNFDQFNFGAKAILGVGRENLGVSYKNTNYSQSLMFPERIHYLNLGYAYVSIKDTVNTRKYSDIKGAELTFQSKIGNNILDFSTSFERKTENSTNDLKSAKTYNIRGKYIEDSYALKSIYHIQGVNNSHLFSLNGQYISGKDGLIDFSPTLDKVNYQVKFLESNLNYLYSSIRPSTWNYDLGIDLQYTSIHRNDYASFLDVKNDYIVIAPFAQARAAFHDKDFIDFTFNPRVILNANNSIGYSENSLNNYIRNVVFWDYDFYRTNKLDLNWSVNWKTRKISAQYLIGFEAKYNLQKNIGSLSDPIFSGFPADLKRNTFSLALSLYL